MSLMFNTSDSVRVNCKEVRIHTPQGEIVTQALKMAEEMIYARQHHHEVKGHHRD